MTIVRELFARFGFVTDDSGVKKFDASLQRANKAMETTGQRARAFAVTVGASLAAAFGADAAKNFINEQSEIVKSLDIYSTAIGESVEDTQKFGFAAREAGLEFDDFAQGILDITERASDATINGGEMAEAFGRLGLALTDVNGVQKDGVSLYLETVDAIGNLGSKAQQTELAMTLFGDAGGRMANIIEGGSEGFLEAANSADAMASVIGGDAFKATKDLAKTQRLLGDATRSAANIMLTKAAPALIKGATALTMFLRNGEAVEKALTTLRIATASFLATLAVQRLVTFATALTALPGMLLGAARAAFTANGAIRALQASMIAIPLAAAGFVLFLQDVSTFMKGGDSATGDFIAKFREADGVMGTVARTLERVAPVLARMFDQIEALAVKALPMLEKAGSQVAEMMLGQLGSSLNMILEIVAKVGPGIIAAFSTVATRVGQIVKQVSELMSGAVGKVLPTIQGVIQSVVNDLPGIIDAVSSLVSSIITIATPILGAAIKIGAALTRITLALLPIFGGVIGKIAALIRGILPVLAGVASVIATIIGGIATGIIAAVDLLTSIFSPIADAAIEFWGHLESAIKPVIALMSKAVALANKIPGVSAITSLFGGGGGSSSSAPSRDIVGQLTNGFSDSMTSRASAAGSSSRSTSTSNVAVGGITLNTGATTASGSELTDVGRSLLRDAGVEFQNRATSRSL